MGRLPPPRRSQAPRSADPAAAAKPAGAARPVHPTASGSGTNDEDLPETFFLGRYRVVDEIGVGGMASVHLGRMDGPGGFQKWVAVKRIHPHLVEDDQFVDMFLDEARIAAGINHAHVAQVFDLGKDDNTYWIAMEYLHGEPLREVTRVFENSNDHLPYHIAAKVCADSADGLHAAHELRGRNGQLLNLVHRDVTPHNLFVTYDGYTKVVDFGIAKVIDRLASTRAGTLKGKLAYMSPEQVRGKDVDRRTDIFALGVVLWELTTSRRLFRMASDLDTLEKVQACIVPRPSTLVRDYPPELEGIVMKALSRNPADRFATARAFSRALQGFLMRLGTFVGPEDVGDYIKTLFTDRMRKREKYLEWAAEVTSAVDLNKMKAQSKDAAGRLPPDPGPPPQPAAPAAAIGQASLDDEEEIPTMVATRGTVQELLGISPAVGAPPAAAIAAPQQQGWNVGVPQNRPQSIETAMSDLDSTIALPDAQAAQDIHAQYQQMNQPPPGPPVNPSPPMTPGPAPMTPGPAPVAAPAAMSQAGQPTPMGQPRPQQGAIETQMNMPRPAAVSQWLKEQGDIEIGGPRSVAVISAIAALATMCVMGIAALIYLKPDPQKTDDPVTVAAAAAAAAQHGGKGAVKDAAGAKAGPGKKGGKGAGKGEASAGESDADSGDSDDSADADASKEGAATSRKAAPKQDVARGKLTVTCKPKCDQVLANGTALGASPVFNYELPPGQYRVTLRAGNKKKTLAAKVVSGQLTTLPVTMK